MNEPMNQSNIKNSGNVNRPKEILRAVYLVYIGILSIGLAQLIEAYFFLNNFPKIQHQFTVAGFMILAIGALAFYRAKNGKARWLKRVNKIRVILLSALCITTIVNSFHFLILFFDIHSLQDVQTKFQMYNALFRSLIFIPITGYVFYLMTKKRVREWYQQSKSD